MISQSLSKLFVRDLDRLKSEINSYDEQKLWITKEAINNSAGNLCLHLVGNLNHFIGALLGDTGYVRNRPLEFSDKDVPRESLLTMVEKTIDVVRSTLEDLTPETVVQPYPDDFFKIEGSTAYYLIHIYGHLNYHLGQINYHRRLVH